MTFLKVIIAVAITAAVVYYGLNLLWPHHSQAEAIEGTYSTAASAGDSNSAMASPAAATSTHDAMSGDTAPVAASTSGNAAATTDIADNSSAPTTDLSEQQTRQVGEQAAIQGVQSMTSASASGAAPTSSSAAEPFPATAPTAAPATLPEAEPAHEQDATAMEPAAATTSAQPAQTASAATPAQATPAHHAAPAMKHTPKAARHTASANTTPLSALPPTADALTAWWTPGSTVQAGQFTVVYAGSAAFEKAIVLLFSNPIGDASAAGQSIHVMGADGKVVSGSWKASDKNPRMLIFSAPAGRYTLVLETSLKDAQGHALESKLSGAVYVR